MFEIVLDVLSLVCLIAATVFSVVAGLGLLRFSDVLSRLHAATKPQVFGLLLTIAAIALHDRSWFTLLALLPIFVFQSLTAPIAAHMVGRAAYRTGQLDDETIMIDELAPAIEQSDRMH
ncbi:MAG: monovalent cation/H(+) antiporter subunit G [Leucobacter sp.]|jgi:multicomponent Na+:H+ antiporter subunit G|nr:monovalent cation/H(+) antiporter subunit G [Leucobacter sp.]